MITRGVDPRLLLALQSAVPCARRGSEEVRKGRSQLHGIDWAMTWSTAHAGTAQCGDVSRAAVRSGLKRDGIGATKGFWVAARGKAPPWFLARTRATVTGRGLSWGVLSKRAGFAVARCVGTGSRSSRG